MTDIRSTESFARTNEHLCALIRSGDQAAREELCIRNERLVTRFAAKFRFRYGSEMDLEDLTQAGYLGLLSAAEHFDPTLHIAFSTYATYWIRQSIGREIMNCEGQIRLPIHVQERIQRLSRLEFEYRDEELSHDERVELFAREMNLSRRKIEELIDLRAHMSNLVSLNAEIGDDNDAQIMDLIADTDTTESQVEENMNREAIANLLEMLDPREAYVIRERFGFNGGCRQTLETLGSEMHLTRERVRQIEKKALRKLRVAVERVPAIA